MPTPLSKAPASADGDQRLAAQHAVQVAPADAHRLDRLGLDAQGDAFAGGGARRIVDALVGGAPDHRPASAGAVVSIGGSLPAALQPRRRRPLGACFLGPVRLPAIGRGDAVDRVGAGERGRFVGIERHRRPAAGAHGLDRLQQRAPVRHDHLVARAEVLARAVLDLSHALDRPLVVQVDVVLAHAEVGARALLFGVEAPVVVAAVRSARSRAASRRPGAARASPPCRAARRSW